MGWAASRIPRRASRVQAADALHPRNAAASVGEIRPKRSSRSSNKAVAPFDDNANAQASAA